MKNEKQKTKNEKQEMKKKFRKAGICSTRYVVQKPMTFLRGIVFFGGGREKNWGGGVEFHQESNGTIRRSLATSYEVSQCCHTMTNFL